MKRTVTIERYHCYGTPRHHLCVTYRGLTLKWAEHDRDGYYLGQVYADMMDYGAESVAAARQHAKRWGFTHVKFSGDWTNKPRGGAL